VIDTLILRFGDVSAAWARVGLAAVGAATSVLAFAAVPFALVWLALALALGVGFRRRVASKETS